MSSKQLQRNSVRYLKPRFFMCAPTK